MGRQDLNVRVAILEQWKADVGGVLKELADNMKRVLAYVETQEAIADAIQKDRARHERRAPENGKRFLGMDAKLAFRVGIALGLVGAGAGGVTMLQKLLAP